MARLDLMRIYDLLYSHYGPRHWWPGDTREEILIGAILTQNTAWANVEKAIEKLIEAGLLLGEEIARAKEERIAELIRSAGYFNQKARRLKDFFSYLDKYYKMDLDAFFGRGLGVVRPELLGLRGIGPETADSMLLYAGEMPTFVIDAYTFRVMRRLGLPRKYYQKKTKTGRWKDDYHTLQRYFMDNLEPDVKLYNEYHALFVEHGKERCRTKPVCEGCPLEDICGE
jgi:endonuclease-3 related protein